METDDKILTPIQIWQDFYPEGAPSFSVASIEKKDGLFKADIFFDALEAEDGKVRAYARAVYPAEGGGFPAVLELRDYRAGIDDDRLCLLARHGYAVFSLDYCGKTKRDEPFTKYPPSLSYGNIDEAGDRLCKAVPNSCSAAPLLWTKVARRAISLIKALPFACGKLAVLGVREGANAGWQTVATDERADCFVSILNAGWQEYAGIYKFGDETLELDNEREMWLAGNSVQAYAKFVKCPFLFLGCSNNKLTPIERLSDTLDVMPSQDKTCAITTGTVNHIEYEGLSTLLKWLGYHLKNEVKPPETPQIELNETDGKLIALIKCDNSGDVQDAVLSFCRAEKYPSLRYWQRVTLGVDFSGKASEVIPVFDEETIFAYATVYYKNGTMQSSGVVTIKPENAERATFKKSRIIYERRMGLSAFIADGYEGLFIGRDSVSLVEGPLDILGVSALQGDLSNYAIGDVKYRGEEGYTLQFDVCSKESAVAELELFTLENGAIVVYGASFEVEGGGWQKISFDISSFKTKTMQPLKDWATVKKMSFKNARGFIFNNILWV